MRPSATFNEALAALQTVRRRQQPARAPSGESGRRPAVEAGVSTMTDPTQPALRRSASRASAGRAGTVRRLALLALAMGGFAIGTTEFVSMGLLPQLAAGVGVSIPTAGHVISAYAVGVVVGAPLIAVFGARLPRRELLVGLMVVFLVGNAASALADRLHSR